MAQVVGTRLALLVLDMQEEFRSAAVTIMSSLNKTIDHCRSRKVPVIFTQHGHRFPEVDGGQLKELWGLDGLIKYGGPRWQLMPELNFVASDYLILEKRRYDAFYGTILENLLRKLKVDTLVISGVLTNLCCETTARSAVVRDYAVIFLADGTASYSAEMQNATLLNIGYGFGKVMTCDAFCAQF